MYKLRMPDAPETQVTHWRPETTLQPVSALTKQTYTERRCLEQRGWSHSQGELADLKKH